MDDARAVMDAVGCERAALFAYWEGGPMAALSPRHTPSGRRRWRCSERLRAVLPSRTTRGTGRGNGLSLPPSMSLKSGGRRRQHRSRTFRPTQTWRSGDGGSPGTERARRRARSAS
jgi:hypothetical protein